MTKDDISSKITLEKNIAGFEHFRKVFESVHFKRTYVMSTVLGMLVIITSG